MIKTKSDREKVESVMRATFYVGLALGLSILAIPAGYGVYKFIYPGCPARDCSDITAELLDKIWAKQNQIFELESRLQACEWRKAKPKKPTR